MTRNELKETSFDDLELERIGILGDDLFEVYAGIIIIKCDKLGVKTYGPWMIEGSVYKMKDTYDLYIGSFFDREFTVYKNGMTKIRVSKSDSDAYEIIKLHLDTEIQKIKEFRKKLLRERIEQDENT